MKKLVVNAENTGSQKFDYQGRAIQILNYPIDCVAYIQFGREQTLFDMRKKIIKPKNFFDSFEIIITKAPSTYYKKIVLFIAETSDEIDYIQANDYAIGLLIGKIDRLIEYLENMNSDIKTLLTLIVDNTYDIAMGTTDHAKDVSGGFSPASPIGSSESYPDIE